jgi:Tfp pilus assembly pilus retraction ATPase PilT
MFEIDKALKTLIEREGSDLHIKVGSRPIIRQHGELVQLDGYEPLAEADTEKAFHDMAEARSLTEFE